MTRRKFGREMTATQTFQRQETGSGIALEWQPCYLATRYCNGLLRTFAVRHSGAGQLSVRSGKRMVAKGKKKRTVLVIAVIGGRIEVLRTH